MTENVPGRVGAEQRVIDIVDLLGRLVGRLRTPLLVIALLPVVPVLLVLAVAGVSGSWLLATLAVLGLVPSVWLIMRRRQLLAALLPPALAVAELRAAFSPSDLGRQLKSNLLEIRGNEAEARPRKLARALWRGVKFGTGAYSQLTETPRLAPFMPGRLRGLAFLTAACVASAIAEGVLALVALLFASLG